MSETRQEAELRRMLEETEKFVAEAHKLEAERRKLQAEADLHTAATIKAYAETEIHRERWLAPIGVIAAIGAGVGSAAAFAAVWRLLQ